MRLVSSAYNTNLAFLAVTTVGKSFMYNKNKGPRIERKSGKTFLVPVPDRTVDSLMAVIDAWIEPGTTVISDSWGAYRDLDTEGYTHRTVNHTIELVDERTGVHTSIIESTWRHVKAFLSPYNRKGDYIHHLAHYMFAVRCRAEKVDQFTKFLHLIATIDWSECPAPSEPTRWSVFRIVDRLPPSFTVSPITGKSACAQHAALHIFTF